MSVFDPITSPESVEFSLSGEDVITDSAVTSERDGVMHTGVGQPHNLEEEFAYVDSVFTNLVMEKVYCLKICIYFIFCKEKGRKDRSFKGLKEEGKKDCRKERRSEGIKERRIEGIKKERWREGLKEELKRENSVGMGSSYM